MRALFTIALCCAAAYGQSPAPSNAATPGDQPQLSSVNIEFVPGERTIFYDDFSDMAQDEPPPHWKLRGGTVDLLTGGGVRELHAHEGVEITSQAFALPANFTFELEWTGGGEMVWHFLTKDNDELLAAMVRGEESGMEAGTSITAKDGETLGEGATDADTNRPVQFALWVQQGRLRAYINGRRLVDVNQVNAAGVDHLYATLSAYRENGIRKIRIAESAPDFSSAITATGRYVTHGILFDTDSDRIRPESAPVIKAVAQGLQKNANLKLQIEGYTDSTGDAAHNRDLSKRRAEAVRTVLVAQFGIDAGRLTAAGLGTDKPAASNDTAQGRAQNRRVEFVRQ